MQSFVLFQDKYFMIADMCKQMDKLNTRESTGVPNFRKSGGGYPVYGMGQPTRNGLSRLMDDLQKEGCPVSHISFTKRAG